VIRPCDAAETAEAWKAAVLNRRGPTALILSRQALPTLDRTVHGAAQGVHQGGYVLAKEDGDLRALIIASGSEVPLALAAREQLQSEGVGVRVVSLPCWELFEQQSKEYRDDVLPPACTKRVAVEAASPFGWERYIGRCGKMVGMTDFGASGPAGQLFEHFGFTAENVAQQVKDLLA
jgi:transketolase